MKEKTIKEIMLLVILLVCLYFGSEYGSCIANTIAFISFGVLVMM